MPRMKLYMVLSALAVGLAGCNGSVTSPGVGPGTPGAAGNGMGGNAGNASGVAGNGGIGGIGGMGGRVGPTSAQDPGRVVMRRLNVSEYNNTVRDLFQTAIRLPDSFPPDDTAYGFNNIADALVLTDSHFQNYQATARALVKEALADPARRMRVLPCNITTGQAACVTTAVTAFLPRAFRRPVAPDEITALVALFTANKGFGLTDDEAIARVFEALLLSPHFLYRVELNSPQGNTIRALDGYELASRLSYFLWGSMPDDELFRAAKANELGDTTKLSGQVRRMLADSKSIALTSSFGAQWLGVRAVDRIHPDKVVFPMFDEDLRAAMREETTMLFSEIAAGNVPVDAILTSTATYLNDRLARHYGLPPVGSATPKRTMVPTARGGLLTHASVLSVLAHPNETAPVLRGKWILSQLLCTEVPPPPADVPQEPNIVPGQSRRDRLKAHRINPSCATCHNLMDPLGLALEQYDGVGAWRTMDNGLTIDPAGVLPDGRAFSGPEELQKMIAKDPQFTRCVTEQAFVYSVGRGKRLGSGDEELLDTVTDSFVKGGAKLPQLIESLVLSEAFRKRQDEMAGGRP